MQYVRLRIQQERALSYIAFEIGPGVIFLRYKDPTHISLKPPQEWLASLQSNRFKPHKVFSDGFWDAPYIPIIPASLQKLFFGLPGGLQAILGWSIIPLRMGESLIVLAEKA